MMKTIWMKFAGISGASAIGMGAYGAHGFKPKDKTFIEVYDRGKIFLFESISNSFKTTY